VWKVEDTGAMIELCLAAPGGQWESKNHRREMGGKGGRKEREEEVLPGCAPE